MSGSPAGDARPHCPCGELAVEGPLVARGPSARHLLCSRCRRIVSDVIQDWFGRRRYRGLLADRIEEIEQEFYQVVLLKEGAFSTFDPDKGRFAPWLWGTARNFCARKRRYFLRPKRDARLSLPLDAAPERAHGATADRAFDRAWAGAVIGRSFERVRARWERDRPGMFEQLVPFLVGPEPDYGAVAAALGLSRGHLRVLVHRLRVAWTEELRAIVADTLDPDGAASAGVPGARERRVTQEIRDLLRSLFDD